MYRFRELDISEVGPFGEDSVLSFKDGPNCICAGNGLGKTTIARALRGDLHDARLKYTGNLNPSIPNWIIYFDESFRLPYAGIRWPALIDLLENKVARNLDWRQLEEAIACGIQEMLEDKVLGKSKFFGAIPSSQQIAVKFNKDGSLNVVDSISGGDLNWGFLALGECTVLYLAINKAIRTLLTVELDMPFVVDSCLGWLDMSLLMPVHRFVNSMDTQVIMLENCVIMERLGISASYEISQDTGSGKSMIVAL